jgi:hypothetical protein
VPRHRLGVVRIAAIKEDVRRELKARSQPGGRLGTLLQTNTPRAENLARLKVDDEPGPHPVAPARTAEAPAAQLLDDPAVGRADARVALHPDHSVSRPCQS